MSTRSPFSVERPPPVYAPLGCAIVIGWELAAGLWHDHLPDPLSRIPICVSCHLAMPCPCWRFADVFLADALTPQSEPAVATRQMPEDGTRELPHVEQPLLPQRNPGTHLQTEARHGGWFTR
jgi:hypothetical protein